MRENPRLDPGREVVESRQQRRKQALHAVAVHQAGDGAEAREQDQGARGGTVEDARPVVEGGGGDGGAERLAEEGDAAHGEAGV